ncbi:MAG: hypothetical protein IJ338_03335 [Bacteroidaceae bacterium]|nr:hypothetical protein [Bacteroidaceae bacterium]
MRTLYFLFSLTILFPACQPTSRKADVMTHEDSLRRAQAIEIKVRAMNTFYHTGGIDSLDFILEQLDKAIQTDTTFTQTYKDKAMVLTSEKDFDAAIEVLKIGRRQQISDIQFPEIVGFLYQKKGDTITAKKYYKEAIQICAEQQKLYPDSIYFPVERALMLGFLYNSMDSMAKEMDKIQEQFPDYPYMQMFVEMSREKDLLQGLLSKLANYDFIKEEYLKSLTPEQQELLRKKINRIFINH